MLNVIACQGGPRGAAGVAQCLQLHQQLSTTAINQMDDARPALAPKLGGPTATSAATILEGPGADGG
ncbi:hypothetical protein ABIA30_003349 [Mycobacterium sp. MAA66]